MLWRFFQFKVISITKGSATTCFLSSRNAQLRHNDFEGCLHHCVNQYSLCGHGSLTSSLCSGADGMLGAKQWRVRPWLGSNVDIYTYVC